MPSPLKSPTAMKKGAKLFPRSNDVEAEKLPAPSPRYTTTPPSRQGPSHPPVVAEATSRLPSLLKSPTAMTGAAKPPPTRGNEGRKSRPAVPAPSAAEPTAKFPSLTSRNETVPVAVSYTHLARGVSRSAVLSVSRADVAPAGRRAANVRLHDLFPASENGGVRRRLCDLPGAGRLGDQLLDGKYSH